MNNKFLIATAVWGNKARQNYVNYHEPSLHLPGNLDALGKDVVHIIYDDRNSHIIPGNPSATMIAMQQRAAAYAYAEDRVLIWTYPDCILMPHSWEEIPCHLASGARTMLYQGATLEMKEFEIRRCLEWLCSMPGFVSNKALMWPLVHEFLHKVSESRIRNWEDPWELDNNWPHVVYTKTDTMFVANAFHSQPVFIWQRKDGSICKTPMDGDFCVHAGMLPEDFAKPYNYACFEFDDGEKTEGLKSGEMLLTMEDWINWAKIHATDFNLETFLNAQPIAAKNGLDIYPRMLQHNMNLVTHVKRTREKEGIKCVTS